MTSYNLYCTITRTIPRQDKTRQDKTRQDKTRQDKTIQDNARLRKRKATQGKGSEQVLTICTIEKWAIDIARKYHECI